MRLVREQALIHIDVIAGIVRGHRAARRRSRQNGDAGRTVLVCVTQAASNIEAWQGLDEFAHVQSRLAENRKAGIALHRERLERTQKQVHRDHVIVLDPRRSVPGLRVMIDAYGIIEGIIECPALQARFLGKVIRRIYRDVVARLPAQRVRARIIIVCVIIAELRIADDVLKTQRVG